MLSRHDDAGVFIKAMRYAHDFTASVNFTDYAEAKRQLTKANAFEDPDSTNLLKVDLMADLLLVYCRPPWTASVGKRLVRTPRVYLRDGGLVHALLGLTTKEDILGHPIVGASWEGFAVDNILSVLPDGAEASF